MDNTISNVRTVRSVGPIMYLLPYALAIGLIAVLYGDCFKWWVYEWTFPGSFYAHAIFVPFFVAIMVYRNRDRIAAEPWKPSWLGIAVLVPSMILLLIGQRLDVTVVQSFSFMLLLFSGTLLLMGERRTRMLLFPLCFVIMMMPLLPDQLINGIAFPIQMTSARLATFILNLIGLHAHQQGTMIAMSNYTMAVELPCSGFKTLVSLLTFTAAYAYLVEGAIWKRWTLFWTTIPLSLLINALRIAFIGMVGEWFGKGAAAIFHDWSGFIVLTLAFLFLFNFSRVLKCQRFLGIPLTDEEDEKDRVAARLRDSEKLPDELPWWRVVMTWRPTTTQLRRALPFAIAIDVGLGMAIGAKALEVKVDAPKPPIATDQMPLQFKAGGVTWDAGVNPGMDKLDHDTLETLNPMRVIMRNYGGSDNSVINLFITAGNGRKTFHDPHTCSLGSDALLSDVGPVTIPTKYGPIKFQECHFQKAGQTDVYEMMIAYIVEHKLVLDPAQTRMAIMRQMFTGDAGIPSYFVRVTQASPGTDAVHRQQLINFISAMWDQAGPILDGNAPGRAQDVLMEYNPPTPGQP